MRGDTEHLRRLQAKLEGAASIDVAGAQVSAPEGGGDGGGEPRWVLPADGPDTARIRPGARLALDVVVRNLLVGHRFPGGVLDIQDTWIEVELADARGRRLAASGLTHDRDPGDQDAHVLRTLVVDERGEVLEEHQMASFRTQIATQTLGPREAQVIRYAFDVPADLTAADFPLTATARLRHRSRTLAMQRTVCEAARTAAGQRLPRRRQGGARRRARSRARPQPITLIAETRVELGHGARLGAARPAWERMYEHGMALVATVSERLDEARAVLDAALAAAPAGDRRARAMILVQLAQVASRQGRADDALALIAEARPLLPSPGPPVLDAVATDALSRVWRWQEAIAPARACAERAPANAGAWIALARALGSAGDDSAALDAATRGLELSPARSGPAAQPGHRARRRCTAARPPRRSPPTSGSARPTPPPSCASTARPTRRAAPASASRATPTRCTRSAAARGSAGAQDFAPPVAQLGGSTPNCLAYSALSRCHPANFMASGPTMRPIG